MEVAHLLEEEALQEAALQVTRLVSVRLFMEI
jgi:hypothetical protein